MKEQGKQDENSEANPGHMESVVAGVAEEGEGGRQRTGRMSGSEYPGGAHRREYDVQRTHCACFQTRVRPISKGANMRLVPEESIRLYREKKKRHLRLTKLTASEVKRWHECKADQILIPQKPSRE